MATILFAEDEKSVREFCEQELGGAGGHRVVLARDVAEAIDFVEREIPDLVVLDLRMPGARGTDAVGPIRTIAPEVPIILFDPNDEPSARDRGARSTAAYARKPEDLAELRREIVKALELCKGGESYRSGRKGAPLSLRAARPAIPPSGHPDTAMYSPISSVAVNAAFLQEIKDDNLELPRLLGELRGALAGSGSIRGQWRRFVELLADLRDGLAVYFALEETYGYFENPVCVAPRLSRDAWTLRTQHERLYSEICAVFEQAEQRAYREARAAAPRKIVLRFVAFCDQLRMHETREEDLILRTFAEGFSGRPPDTLVR